MKIIKFETPASKPLKKAVEGKELLENDWKAIINYIGCQIVRTPAFVSRMLETSKENMENIFQQTIVSISEKLNNMPVEELKSYLKNEKNSNDDKMFPLKIVDTGINCDEDKTLLKIETIMGKSYYLYMLLHLLKNTIKVLHLELNYELSIKIKTMIVEHAQRRIFSIDKERWITKVRKRYVNSDEFQREKEMLENWHKNYKNIESEYLDHKLVRRNA